MNVIPGQEQAWFEQVKLNRGDTGYSYPIILAAAAAGRVLDDPNKSCHEARQATYGRGLSGFQGAAVRDILVEFHQRGVEFRDYCNGVPS